jgi:hypothetical protein
MISHARRPWHLTLISPLSLIWYLLLAADYLNLRNTSLAEWIVVPESWVTVVHDMPLWASIAFGASVWLGVLASVLLVFRDKGAVLSFSFTCLAAMVAGLWFGLFSPTEPRTIFGIDPPVLLILQASIPAILWVYARAMKQIRIIG